MKVLLLLGLFIATALAYPVADEGSTSTVVVDYSAVAKDTSASHEHVHQDSAESSEFSESSEEKVEGPKAEAVVGQKEATPIADQVQPASSEENKEEVKAIVEVKPEPVPIAQDELLTILPEGPIALVAPEAPQSVPTAPIEEILEVPEAPVALPTVNADDSLKKEPKIEDEPLKVEENKLESEQDALVIPIQPIDEDIKIEATEEVKVVEEPKLQAPREATEEFIVPVQPEMPAVQDPVPVTLPELPKEEKIASVADALPEVPVVVEAEKKERKEDAPVETLGQQEPTADLSAVPIQPNEVKEEVLVPLVASDLPSEQLPIVAVPIPAVPAVITPLDSQPEVALIPEEPQQVPVAEVAAPVVPEVVLPAELVPLTQGEPVVLSEQSDPVAPVQLVEVPTVEQNQVVQDKEVPEVQEVQETKVAESQPQEIVPAPAVMPVPEAPTLPAEVQATPVDADPVKAEEPVLAAAAPAVDTPQTPKQVEPEVSKDLKQETH